MQCGFCTPGLIVASHDLLSRNAYPTDAEIREALAGNLCRCTGYEKILDAVRLAAERAMRTVIEGCAIATVDAAGTEHRDGHLVIEGDRIVAVGEGRAPATDPRDARRIDGRGCLATPGARQLPPPPLPVGHARPGPAGDALRVARRALSDLGARRRRGRVRGGARRAGRARALGLLDLDRPPLRLPGAAPATCSRSRSRRRAGSACASTRAAGRWTSGAPTAACRPTRSSRTATRSSPPARRPSTASTTPRPGRWCAWRWRRARRSR